MRSEDRSKYQSNCREKFLDHKGGGDAAGYNYTPSQIGLAQVGQKGWDWRSSGRGLLREKARLRGLVLHRTG